jgi:hypothetical protein
MFMPALRRGRPVQADLKVGLYVRRRRRGWQADLRVGLYVRNPRACVKNGWRGSAQVPPAVSHARPFACGRR